MAEEKLSSDGRKAMWSQFLGFGMDAYDMAMVIVLSPLLAKIFADKNLPEAWQFLAIASFIRSSELAEPTIHAPP